MRFNYGRIVVIDFRNAKTLPLRKCFARLCGEFVHFKVSEVEMLWKVMFKYRFLRIQTMRFVEIVHHSRKCDFSKTHLQYDARILFQPGPFRYTVEARVRKCSHFVIKSESQRQILIKNRNFPHYLQLLCKAISLGKCFFIKISKSESRGAHGPNHRENLGSKR